MQHTAQDMANGRPPQARRSEPVFERRLADHEFDPSTRAAIVQLVNWCHGAQVAAGWWSDLKTGEDLRSLTNLRGQPVDLKINVPEKLCLIHSEVSEAMEGHRKGLMDDKLPHRPMLEVELADAAIRIFDLAGGIGLDLAGALVEKMAFNASRKDHRPENRKLAGGKAF